MIDADADLPFMRPVIVLVVSGLALTACGRAEAPSDLSSTRPTRSPVATSVPANDSGLKATTPTTDATRATTVSEPASSEPGRPSNDAAQTSRMLSIADALLLDDALGAPWELQWRNTDQIAYGAGPNQTDCVPYWAVEQARGGAGGHVMWWVDGGNANHYVRRTTTSGGFAALRELASIPEQCPLVHWNEGGQFSTEAVAVSDGVGLRLVDGQTGDVTWLAAAAHGALLSVLDVPLWTNVDGQQVDFGIAELRLLVKRMNEQLQTAGAEPGAPSAAEPSTTSTTSPSSTPSTTAPWPTTQDEDATGLALLLLDESDLPAGFDSPSIRMHGAGETDDDFESTCPAGASIARIDAILEWAASSYRHNDGIEVEQMIGRASSATEATELVELFAAMAACDLSDSFGDDVSTSGGALDIAGADAAAHLVIADPLAGFSGEIVVIAVGDVVVIATITSNETLDVDQDLADSIAMLVAAKVRAGPTN